MHQILEATPVGGCWGKSAIIDIKVEPAIDCLKIEVNNCNGGILEVTSPRPGT